MVVSSRKLITLNLSTHRSLSAQILRNESKSILLEIGKGVGSELTVGMKYWVSGVKQKMNYFPGVYGM